MASGTIPQAVQRGALMPATARAAIGVLRDSPPGRRLKKMSGASAVRLTWTAWADPQSADWPLPDVASAAVAKQAQLEHHYAVLAPNESARSIDQWQRKTDQCQLKNVGS